MTKRSFSILGVRIVYSTEMMTANGAPCFDLSVSSEFGSSIQLIADAGVPAVIVTFQYPRSSDRLFNYAVVALVAEIQLTFSILGVRIVYSTRATMLV